MSQKTITVSFSPGLNKVERTATGLVRFQNRVNGSCSHVDLKEDGNVEVYVCDPALDIMDLENAVITPQDDLPDFHEALSSNSEMSKTEKALAIVNEFPYRTSQEMASKVNPSIITADSLHKRLSDLYKKGKIRKVQERTCSVTGKVSTTWAPVEG